MVHVNDCKPEDVVACGKSSLANFVFGLCSVCFKVAPMCIGEELFTGGQPRPGDIVSFEVEPRQDTLAPT